MDAANYSFKILTPADIQAVFDVLAPQHAVNGKLELILEHHDAHRKSEVSPGSLSELGQCMGDKPLIIRCTLDGNLQEHVENACTALVPILEAGYRFHNGQEPIDPCGIYIAGETNRAHVAGHRRGVLFYPDRIELAFNNPVYHLKVEPWPEFKDEFRNYLASLIHRLRERDIRYQKA